MKINEIIARNVKGRDFAHKLGPVNMFVGDNGKGKTARLAAIRLALWGHEPMLNNTLPSVTWKLAGNADTEMYAAIVTDTGELTRTWKLKGDKVSLTSKLPEGWDEEQPPMPDSRGFFGLKTANARRDLIFQAFKIGDGEYSPTSLITKLKTVKIDDMTDYHTVALEEVVSQVMDSARNRSIELKAKKDYPFQRWLAEMGEQIKADIKNAKETVDRMSKGIASMTQLQSAENQAISRPVDLVEADIAALQSVLNDLNKELGTLEAADKQETEKQYQRKTFKYELDNLPEQKLEDASELQADHTKALTTRAELRHKIESIQQQLVASDKAIAAESAKERLRNGHQSTLARTADPTEALQTAEAEYKRLDAEFKAYKSQTAALKSERGGKEQNVKITQGEIHDREEKIAKLNEQCETVLAKDCCPTCKSKGNGWTEAYRAWHKAEVDAILAEISEKQRRILSLQGEIQSLNQAIAVADDADVKHYQDLQEIQKVEQETKELQLCKNLIHSADTELDRLGAPCLDDLREKHNALLQTAKEHQHNYEVAGGNYDILDARLKAFHVAQANQQRRKTLTQQLETLGEPAPVDYTGLVLVMREKIQTHQGDMAKLQKEKNEASAGQQDELRKQQSQQELEKARARHEVLKAAQTIQQTYQREVVNSVFTNLTATANTLVGTLLRSPLEYREGIIGRTENNKFIEEISFSGIDQVMTYMAFGVALAPDAPFKLVIIDELAGTFSPRNRLRLLAQMVELVEKGIIHQFIGADPDAGLYREQSELAGVNVIRLD